MRCSIKGCCSIQNFIPLFSPKVGDISVFETNIRYVGGLLALYAFTGDDLFRTKAVHIADKLLPAFNTPTGIPYALINVKTGVRALRV